VKVAADVASNDDERNVTTKAAKQVKSNFRQFLKIEFLKAKKRKNVVIFVQFG
jgi:hypothetical protein